MAKTANRGEWRTVGCREPGPFRQKMRLLWRAHSDAQPVRLLGSLDGLTRKSSLTAFTVVWSGRPCRLPSRFDQGCRALAGYRSVAARSASPLTRSPQDGHAPFRPLGSLAPASRCDHLSNSRLREISDGICCLGKQLGMPGESPDDLVYCCSARKCTGKRIIGTGSYAVFPL